MIQGWTRVQIANRSWLWVSAVGCLLLCENIGCSSRTEFNRSDYQKVTKTTAEGPRQLPPGSFGSGAMQYGSGMMPFGSGAMPYSSGAMPYGSGAMPYGSGAMPYGSGAMPYGSGAMPFGSGAMPYGSSAVSFGSGTPFGSSAIRVSAPAARSANKFPRFGSAYPVQ